MATEAYSEACDSSFEWTCSVAGEEPHQQLVEEAMAPEDFCRVCREQVKISARNKALLEKWWPNAEEKKFRSNHSRPPSKHETGHKLVSAPTGESQFSSSEVQTQPAATSLILLFCTGRHDSLNLIPDYELERCKAICCEMMSRTEQSSAEARFALGRLLAYEGEYSQALELVTAAHIQTPDELYISWELIIRVLLARRKPPSQPQKKSCNPQSVWSAIVSACSSREGKRTAGALTSPSDKDIAHMQVEQLWCYFELALLDQDSGLGDPRRYASELRETHSYLGYLSWALIYLHSEGALDWIKGLEILQELVRTHPKSPEAYLKLWEVYYTRLKDFELAMDTIEQAFLKASDNALFKLLISLRYAKTLWRLRKTDACLSFLHTQYVEQSCAHLCYLYLYGRLSVESENLDERIAAINALRETTRLGARKRVGLGYYWLGKAHLLGRETAQAVAAFQRAVELLPISQGKKISETRAYLASMVTFSQGLQRLKALGAVRDRKAAADAQRLMKTVAMVDTSAAEMEYARVLFRTGLQGSALALLQAISERTQESLEAGIARLKLLKTKGNAEAVRTEAEKLIEKGTNFPCHELARVAVLYAQSVALAGSPYKALLVLKCVGKMFTPVELSVCPYIWGIQRASDVTQLARTPSDLLWRPDLSASLTATVATRDDFASLLQEVMRCSSEDIKGRYEPRPTPSTHESPSIFQRSFKSPINQSHALDLTASSVCCRKRFSQCSDLSFLYKIGKLTTCHSLAPEDGLWALKDFLQLAKCRLPGAGSEPLKRLEKARSMLYSLLKDARGTDESLTRSFEAV